MQDPITEINPIWKKMEGGLSQDVYLVGNQYIYRQYHQRPHPREMKIVHLMSRSKLGPEVLHFDPSGRMEEFLSGGTMDHLDLGDNLSEVIERIHQLHQLVPDLDLNGVTGVNQIQGNFILFKKMKKWMKEVKHILPVKPGVFWYELLEKHQPWTKWPEKQGFCHHDLHVGNIMKDGVKFIDFELSGWGYQIYDWANFVNEAELELDLSENQYKLVRNPSVEKAVLESLNIDGQDKEYMKRWRFYRNLSHFFWGLWGLMEKQKRSTLREQEADFNYGDYSQLRFSLMN